MKLLAKAVFVLLVACYPFAIYFGLQVYSLKQMAFVFLAVFVLRLYMQFTDEPTNDSQDMQKNVAQVAQRFALIGGTLLIAGVLLLDSAILLKVYPAMVSLLMLLAFGWTLINPPSAIERIARKLEPDLSETGVQHTRQFTQIWCVFFAFNGLIAAYTAFFSSMKIWMLYNGLISYLLIGLLFSTEFIVRLYRKKRAGE